MRQTRQKAAKSADKGNIMSKFAQLGLSPQLTETLEKAEYTQPTPIQEKVIPLMLEGRDIVGIAQTGTGKTAAFVLPILEKLHTAQSKSRPKHCTALIIVPTRELASQIDDNIAKYGAHVYHERACIVGGVKYPKQISRLNRGLDILVATPGRLEDHLKSGNLSLAHTEIIILDEADQMLDLGFLPAIRRIVKLAPRTRQTILLSATMPKAIRSLAGELLDKPVDVAVAKQATPIEKIEQAIMLMEKPDKRPFTVRAVENQFRTIIFTRTKHGADQLVKYMAKQGVNASAIHGNKSQSQRQRALDAFRKGQEHILIATDIAARGIDIPDVSLVINYDVPTTPESYVHRIGRTARAGREGRAITLCSPEEQKYLRDIERLIKMKLPTENVSVGEIDDAEYDPIKAASAAKVQPSSGAKFDPSEKTNRRRSGGHRGSSSKGGASSRGASSGGEKRGARDGDKRAAPKGGGYKGGDSRDGARDGGGRDGARDAKKGGASKGGWRDAAPKGAPKGGGRDGAPKGSSSGSGGRDGYKGGAKGGAPKGGRDGYKGGARGGSPRGGAPGGGSPRGGGKPNQRNHNRPR